MTDITKTLEERGVLYGDFMERAVCSQNFQDDMRDTRGWAHLRADQAQALTTIVDKIARILNGDPDYLDNWHDIIGYATLVENRLLADQAKAEQVASKTGRQIFPQVNMPGRIYAADMWHPWTGGDMPVPEGTRIDVRYRDSHNEYDIPAGVITDASRRGALAWDHINVNGDIVAFRVRAAAEGLVKTRPWITWTGGDRPVAENVQVKIRMRNGDMHSARASDLRWSHFTHPAGSGDIVAYRTVID